MIKRIIFVFLLAISSNAFASGYLVPNGSGVEIQKIHAHPNGAITLWVDASKLENPDGCNRMHKVHIKATEGYQTLVSMVMSAYVSGKKIGFWSTGCEVIPFWGASPTTSPVVNNIWITN